MASVRFICGTQTVHKELEARAQPRSSAPRTRSSTRRASTPTAACSRRCSTSRTASSRDALNHASIIDGIRLCKAQRLRYANNDMAELEQRLQEAADARFRLIATDGVFSMDGVIADLARDLRPRRAVRRDGDGRRLARRRLRRRERPRHAGALRRDGPGRHHHRHARQGAGRRSRRLHQRPRRRSSTGCASARGPTCSPTRWRRRSPPPRCRCSSCCSRPTSCSASSQRNARAVPRGHGGGRLHARRRRPPDHPGDARRRAGRRRDGRAAAGRRAST